jgi:hypothetical protein
VSGVKNRAAVFNSEPQAVEVYQAGAWWAGELLGWRHEVDGSCQVRVRVTLGGVEETAWMDLTGLRLPERHLVVAPDTAVSADPAVTQKLPRASSSTRRQRPAPAQPAATAGMPAVRELSGVPAAPRSGGRRRAPEGVEAPATVLAPVAPGSGGRRRAPEGPETVTEAVASAGRAGGRRRAPEAAAPAEVQDDLASSAASLAGRHRALLPVDAGRHRKADTGLFPAVTESTATMGLPPRPRARLDDTFGGRVRGVRTDLADPEPELLTRPMRLSDHIPHARRPRVDGSLTG